MVTPCGQRTEHVFDILGDTPTPTEQRGQMSHGSRDAPLCRGRRTLLSVVTMTSTTVHATPISFSRTMITVVAATVGALAIWAAETKGLHVDLTVAMGATPQPVTAAAVVLTALVAGVSGSLTARVLTRFAGRRAHTAWMVLAGLVLLLSLLGPLGATSVAGVVALAVLHLVVGLTLIVGLRPARGYGE
jgi:hypothetical protein